MDSRTFDYKSPRVAAFDLDWTLLKPVKGMRPKDRDDAVVVFPNVNSVLSELREKGYRIVIFTNQSSKCNPADIYYKIDKYLIPNIDVYIALGHTIYRKPSPTMCDIMCKDNGPIEDLFYVGDCGGRPGDYYNSDLLFAHNCNIPFHTPEEYFSGVKSVLPAVVPLTPLKPKAFNKKITGCTVIILTGYPGCGKSTFASEYITGQECTSIIINNDAMKTRAYKTYTHALSLRTECIIVDNVNGKRTSRIQYIEPALDAGYKVWHLHFDVPIEHAKLWNWWRGYNGGTFVPEIAYTMLSAHWEEPTAEEGYTYQGVIVPRVSSEIYRATFS